MPTPSQLGAKLKDELGLKYHPVGFYYVDQKPSEAVGFKKDGGCIMGMIFAAAKGKMVAFDKDSAGWSCAAFYLGFRDWIREGIEYFLAHGNAEFEECEKIVAAPEKAKEYLESLRFPELATGAAVFKPLEKFSADETPELVLLFANPDQLGALSYLAQYRDPVADDLVVSRFASGCGAVVSVPMDYKRRGLKRAVWGGHDMTARRKLPADLMTFTVPYDFAVEFYEDLDSSFVNEPEWVKIRERCLSKPSQ